MGDWKLVVRTCRHIPIKTVVENKRRFLSAGSRSRDNKRLLFESIDALVKYYKVYCRRSETTVECRVDEEKWVTVHSMVYGRSAGTTVDSTVDDDKWVTVYCRGTHTTVDSTVDDATVI